MITNCRLPERWFIAAAFAALGIVLVASYTSARISVDTDKFNKTVAFIYGAGSSGLAADPAQSLGTGFFVEVPLISAPNRSYKMFVTARHIVDPQWAGCPGRNPSKLFLRVNTKNFDPVRDTTGVDFVAVDLMKDGKPSWAHSVSDDVDVAVIAIDPGTLDKFDWTSISIREFAADGELNARYPSDPVASVGLLPAYPGVRRNYPVLKLGYISNKPDEPVAVQCVPNGVNRLLRLWLLSINLVPGNSGAPIIYFPEGSNGITFGGGRPSLIGLQSMSFLGSDVAGMTPANYIYQVIEAQHPPDADLRRAVPAVSPTPKQ